MRRTAKRKQGGKGVPFAKGVSGNPGGRRPYSKEKVDAQDYARVFTKEAVDTVVSIMRGEPQQVDVDKEGKPVKARPGISARKDAAVELLDRGWGTPAQAVEITGQQVVTHVVADDFIERLDGRIAGVRQRLAEQGLLPRPN